MAAKIYNLFISHAWKYDDDYNRLVNLLNKAKTDKKIDFKNYLVPQHDPVIDPKTNAGKKKLKAALETQIKPVAVY